MIMAELSRTAAGLAGAGGIHPSPAGLAGLGRRIDQLALALQAERDENTCRQDFKPSEAVALGRQIEELERPQAKCRKVRGTPAKPSGNLPEGSKGETREKVGAALGISGKVRDKVGAARSLIRDRRRAGAARWPSGGREYRRSCRSRSTHDGLHLGLVNGQCFGCCDAMPRRRFGDWAVRSVAPPVGRSGIGRLWGVAAGRLIAWCGSAHRVAPLTRVREARDGRRHGGCE